jgi:hypothetical protein
MAESAQDALSGCHQDCGLYRENPVHKTQGGKMDIGKAFGFVFEDEKWVIKVLIGAAILLVGFLFSWLLLIPLILAYVLLAGYGVEIIRQVMRGELDKLPEWDDWGALLRDGLMALIISVVYALPLIILSVCMSLPIAIFAEDAEALSSLFSVALSCFSFLYFIAMSIVLPAAVAFYAAEDDLGAAFRFGEVFAFVRDNVATYFVTFVLSWVANFIGSLGSVVCGVGALVTVPYSFMVIGHLYGQAYVVSKGQSLQPAIAEPEEIA